MTRWAWQTTRGRRSRQEEAVTVHVVQGPKYSTSKRISGMMALTTLSLRKFKTAQIESNKINLEDQFVAILWRQLLILLSLLMDLYHH